MKTVSISHNASPLLGQQLLKSGALGGWSSDGSGRRRRGPMQCVAMVTAPVSDLATFMRFDLCCDYTCVAFNKQQLSALFLRALLSQALGGMVVQLCDAVPMCADRSGSSEAGSC